MLLIVAYLPTFTAICEMVDIHKLIKHQYWLFHKVNIGVFSQSIPLCAIDSLRDRYDAQQKQ